MMLGTSLSIKILARNSDLKGKSFEEFMYLLLDKLGYRNFILRAYSTGMEFDIKANHKEKKQSILCECKAHEKEMDTGELLRFFGKLCHERSKNRLLKGMFFSVSGFNGTALKNYSELSEDKTIFELYGNNEIVELLRTSGVFASNEEIEKSVNLHSNRYPLGKRYLVYFESNIYLVQLINIAGLPRNYIILTARGEIVNKSVRDNITTLDTQLNSLEQLDLAIIDEVLLALLDNREKAVGVVSEETRIKNEDVKVALEELELEKIVDKISAYDDEKQFKIVSDIDTLGKVIKKLIDKPILFRYNDDFKNNFEQIIRSSLSEAEKRALRNKQSRLFMGEILSETYLDIQKIPDKYLDSRGVRGFNIENGIKLATDDGLVIDLADRQPFYLGRAAGEIKLGQLVSGGIDTVWKMAITLLDLREYVNAIEYFDKVISLSGERNNYLVGAWNNKGLCFLRMKEYEEAISCFKEVLAVDDAHNEALTNLKFCLGKLKVKSIELKTMQERIGRLLQDEYEYD
jgi:tetratricopeptide (TPR) repeat protein